MIGYRPVPYAAKLAGAVYGPPGPARSLGQASDIPALVPMIGLGLAGLAFVGTTGWMGIRTGLNEKGWLSALGWITGIGGILLGGFFFSVPVGVLFAAVQKPGTSASTVQPQAK